MAEFSVKTDKLTGAAVDLAGVNSSLQSIYTSVYSVKSNLGFKVRSLEGIEQQLNQAASEISTERMLCISMKNAAPNVSKAYSSTENKIVSNAKEGNRIKGAQSTSLSGGGTAGGGGGGGAWDPQPINKEQIVSVLGEIWDGVSPWLDALSDSSYLKATTALGVTAGLDVATLIGAVIEGREIYKETGDLGEAIVKSAAHAAIEESIQWAGGKLGAIAGGAAGGALGSEVPGIGNVAGAAAGEVIGQAAGAFVADYYLSEPAKELFDEFYDSHKDDMKKSTDTAIKYNNGQYVGVIHP